MSMCSFSEQLCQQSLCVCGLVEFGYFNELLLEAPDYSLIADLLAQFFEVGVCW